jgi:hypothetical protein
MLLLTSRKKIILQSSSSNVLQIFDIFSQTCSRYKKNTEKYFLKPKTHHFLRNVQIYAEMECKNTTYLSDELAKTGDFSLCRILHISCRPAVNETRKLKSERNTKACNLYREVKM